MKSVCVDCFKTVGEKSRAEIYEFLQKNGPQTVSQIVGKFKLTQPTISHHLSELEKVGLLVREKKGREVVYSVSNDCKYDKGCSCPICE